MSPAKACGAGAIGAAVLSALMFALRAAGLELNVELLLASPITQRADVWTWVTGFIAHLGIGAVFGLLYGYLFEHETHRAGWGVGTLFGVGHAIVGGVLLSAFPLVFPVIVQAIPTLPAILAFAGLHLVYGAIVGALYAPTSVFGTRRSVRLDQA